MVMYGHILEHLSTLFKYDSVKLIYQRVKQIPRKYTL